MYLRVRGAPTFIQCSVEATSRSTPIAAIFVSSLSGGPKSIAFEKSIIVSVLTPSSNESAISWQTVTNWLWHEYPVLKPCWPSYNQPLISQTSLSYPAVTCYLWFSWSYLALDGVCDPLSAPLSRTRLWGEPPPGSGRGPTVLAPFAGIQLSSKFFSTFPHGILSFLALLQRFILLACCVIVLIVYNVSFGLRHVCVRDVELMLSAIVHVSN